MKWEKATVWVSRCPLCRLGAEPRTSPGRCRCLASRLLGPRLRAAHPLPAHARERALASRQPGALSQALPRRRNRAHSAPEPSASQRGCGGRVSRGGVAHHEDAGGQSERAGPHRGSASEQAAPSIWLRVGERVLQPGWGSGARRPGTGVPRAWDSLQFSPCLRVIRW